MPSLSQLTDTFTYLLAQYLLGDVHIHVLQNIDSVYPVRALVHLFLLGLQGACDRYALRNLHTIRHSVQHRRAPLALVTVQSQHRIVLDYVPNLFRSSWEH